MTPREREVLHWLAEGKSNWETAQILECTEETVKMHR
ncbi:MAG: helix-turn-helix transcriptional regulator [Chthoniobacterales bacterium]|nr:helix-turn-helix transcriptional regulator [Chthoniobacterales bacterium]